MAEEESSSVESCENSCTLTEGCIGFTYIRAMRRCDLKAKHNIGHPFDDHVEREGLVAGVQEDVLDWVKVGEEWARAQEYPAPPAQSCRRHADCPRTKACSPTGVCASPCPAACGPGALCTVANHVASCTCPAATSGNPRSIRGCNGEVGPAETTENQEDCSCSKEKPFTSINVTDILTTKLSNNPQVDDERTDSLIDIANAIEDKRIRKILGEETAKEVEKQLGDLVELYKSYNEVEPPFLPVPFDPIPNPGFDVFSINSFLPTDDPEETKEFAQNDPGPLTGKPPGPTTNYPENQTNYTTTTTKKPLIVTLEDGRVVELPSWLNIARRRRMAERPAEETPEQMVTKVAVEETDATLASLQEQIDWLQEESKLLGEER